MTTPSTPALTSNPASATPDSSPPLYQQLEAYPWSSDHDFQSGLTGILGPSPSSALTATQLEELVVRARCFFYTQRYNVPIDFEDYRSWRAAQLPSRVAPARLASNSSRSTTIDHPADPDELQHPSYIRQDTTSGDEEPDINPQASETNPAPSLPHEQQQLQPAYPPTFEEIIQLIQSGQPIPGIKDIPDTVLLGQGTEATRSRRRKPWEKGQITQQQPGVFAAHSRPSS